MYLPPHFIEDRLEVQHGLIRARPLGLLVSHSDAGLQADAVPFLLDDTASPLGTLRAHFARANSHLLGLNERSEVMIVFQGENAYISPSWYPTKADSGKVVPTWNYVVVEAWGHPRVMDDSRFIAAQIRALTDAHESTRQHPWQVDDAPSEFIAAQMRAIVGLEIEITRLAGKWKTSQNRTERDRAGVRAGLATEGPHAAAMAALIPV